jgi:hypothetical protein
MTGVPPVDDIWGGVPDARRVNVSELTPEQLEAHLMSYIDAQTAHEIVMKIDGSATDYATNMRRITEVLNGLTFGLGMAMKIILVA